MTGLLERGQQLDRINAAFDAALDSRGQCLAVTGPAGIGKTALLDMTRQKAQSFSFRIGIASGGMLERDHPFGVTRDLIESILRSLDSTSINGILDGIAGDAAAALGLCSSLGRHVPADRGALMHGLYWVVANMAESAPLILIADDAHWFDAPSLRFLSYLSRRLDGLRVLLLLGSRTAGPGIEGELLTTLLADPSVQQMALSPLSTFGVSEILRAELGQDPDSEFVSACTNTAGGNPFMTLELIRALKAEHVRPLAVEAHRVLEAGGSRAGTAILRRLHGLPESALSLARAVAVLGRDNGPTATIQLAEIDEDEALEMTGLLIRSDIFADEVPLRFAHPLVGAAVYAELSGATRSSDHARAARILAQLGVEPSRSAAHLFETVPAGDAWVTSLLLSASRAALASGATESAARFLYRALAEPPSREQRVDVLATLGDAERALNWTSSVSHLREALSLAASPEQAFDLVLLLRSALVEQSRFADAVTAVEEVLTVLTDPNQRMRLEASIVHIAYCDAKVLAAARKHIDIVRSYVSGTDEIPADVLGVGAVALALTRAPASLVGEVAYRALVQQRDHSDRPVAPWCSLPLWLMVMCEHSMAESMLTWCAEQAERQGEVLQHGQALINRGWTRLRTGDLVGAESDGRTSLEVFALGEFGLITLECAAIVAHVLLERGEVAQAAALLNETRGPFPDGHISVPFFLRARAQSHIAQGRLDDAVRDLRDCGVRCDALRAIPGFLPWRSDLAIALAAKGWTPEAAMFATDAVKLAREFGAPRALGIALRGLGVVTKDEATLVEAVTVLDGANAQLELARALTDLGTLQRAANNRVAARGHLLRALELAARSGSKTLEVRARDELKHVGTRPRRTAVAGVASLTASELRSATLAADGLTNKEIAQSTFVALKTVETQLASAYRKLGIRRRNDLGDALSG